MLGGGILYRYKSASPVKVTRPANIKAPPRQIDLTAVTPVKTYDNLPNHLTLSRVVSSATDGRESLLDLETSTMRVSRCAVTVSKPCNVSFWPVGYATQWDSRRQMYVTYGYPFYEDYAESALISFFHVVAPPGHQIRVSVKWWMNSDILYFAPFDPTTGYVNRTAMRVLNGTLDTMTWAEPPPLRTGPEPPNEYGVDFDAHYVSLLSI